jgi:arylsulfatase A-like enzyme
VLLLTIDALRADMPWSGYPRAIAPHLTALAAQSAVWENHRSVASYTAQTVATLLSGQYASSLYRDGWFFTGYSEQNWFFPEALEERGIKSAGLHAHMYFGKGKGLQQGFHVWETVPGISFDAQTDHHVTSPKSAARLIEMLGQPERQSDQFFVWSHFMDPHDQYILHDEAPNYGTRNRDRYDSEVFFTDLWLGKVLEFARAQPWWERTAVIVTGDHGEAFGEHGMYKHAFDLWDVLVRVPLIIRAPGAAPVRITQGRTHIDLAPTILDLMGLPPLEQFRGQSLVPEIYGERPGPRPILLELAEDSHNPGLRSIVHGDYKLITQTQGGKPRLFNLRDDPGELNNLAALERDKLREMTALLEQAFGGVPNIEPYGGMKLQSGRRAMGHERPSKE